MESTQESVVEQTPVVKPIAPPPPIMIPKSKEYNNHPEDVLNSIEKTISKPQETRESIIVKVFRNIGEFFHLRIGSRRSFTEQGLRQTGH